MIVDHGLRPESQAEANETAARLAARGIDRHVLAWTGAKPASGIQAAAREARHRLLGDWCRATGVLHLVLAHHRDDQAETVALRTERGSGPDGLAGMAPVREANGFRLLRPLLGVAKARLAATLREAGQVWLEDPSNRAPHFARARLRRAGILDTRRLAQLADACAQARIDWDERLQTWLAAHARIAPAGFVELAAEPFVAAPFELARRALGRALITVGGRPYPPRQARLVRLVAELRRGAGVARTLGGCCIVPRGGRILVCREPGAIDQVAPLQAEGALLWDRRFLIVCAGGVAGLSARGLGEDGIRQCAAMHGADALRALPAPVRPGLPSVWGGGRLLAAPSLGLFDPQLAGREIGVRFYPPVPLAGACFGARHGPAGGDRRPLLRRNHGLC